MFDKQTANTDVIIPATNHTLARFKYPDGRPKIQSVISGVEYRPIIAWRVRSNGRVEPITVELELLGGRTSVVVGANGINKGQGGMEQNRALLRCRAPAWATFANRPG